MGKIASFAVVAAALLTVALLSGCDESPEMLDGDGYIDRSGVKIVSFSYSESGSSADSFVNYRLEAQGDDALFAAEYLRLGKVEVLVGLEEFDKLQEIVVVHGLDQWDGFAESDSVVSDGSRFSLSYTYEDEVAVSARGSNSFPEGYGAASDDIRAFFEGLLEQYAPRGESV